MTADCDDNKNDHKFEKDNLKKDNNVIDIEIYIEIIS